MHQIPQASPTPARIVLGLCAAICIGICFWVNYYSNSKMDELFKKGTYIKGEVTGRACNNHGKLRYSYSVDGKTYNGIGNCARPCEMTEIGAPVSVIYLPRIPGRSSCESRQEIESRSKGLYFAMIFMTIFAVAGIYHITRTDNDEQAKR